MSMRTRTTIDTTTTRASRCPPDPTATGTATSPCGMPTRTCPMRITPTATDAERPRRRREPAGALPLDGRMLPLCARSRWSVTLKGPGRNGRARAADAERGLNAFGLGCGGLQREPQAHPHILRRREPWRRHWVRRRRRSPRRGSATAPVSRCQLLAQKAHEECVQLRQIACQISVAKGCNVVRVISAQEFRQDHLPRKPLLRLDAQHEVASGSSGSPVSVDERVNVV